MNKSGDGSVAPGVCSRAVLPVPREIPTSQLDSRLWR